MLNSINNLRKVYQPKRSKKKAPRKPQPPIYTFPPLPRQSGIYQIAGQRQYAFTRFFGDSLKHFGVFSGDTLTINRTVKWGDVQSKSLYAVLLPNNDALVCAIKFESLDRVSLHDGLGGNSVIYAKSLIYLVGLVVGIQPDSKGAK